MSTLENRPNTALVVIDVQNDVIDGTYRCDEVIVNIAELVTRARSAGTTVVWVQHHDDELEQGSLGWEYVPELVRSESEPVVHKSFGDAFESTDLEAVLAERGIGSLIVAGAQTDACIRSTLHGAIARGYDAVLVSDAHTTEDFSDYGAPTPDLVIAHTNLYWQHHTAPGRTAGTVTTVDVSFTTT